MKFVVQAEHHHYFENNQQIEFQDFIAPALQKELLERLEAHLAKKRIGLPGRDGWKVDARLKGFVTGRALAEIAATLLPARKLLLGYDHYFPKPVESLVTTLEKMSGIQGVLGGWLVTLGGEKAGSVTLLHSQAEIDFSHLEGPTLLIVYATPDAVFVNREGSLKESGYSQGDNLYRKGHPLILS